MNKLFVLVFCGLVMSPVLQAQEHEKDRLKHSGEVLKEILNIPDNIPKGVLDLSDCVIVIPSVKKFAIGIGGDYGRGAMTCRSGGNFSGPWGAAAVVALEGGNIGFPLGWPGTGLCLP